MLPQELHLIKSDTVMQVSCTEDPEISVWCRKTLGMRQSKLPRCTCIPMWMNAARYTRIISLLLHRTEEQLMKQLQGNNSGKRKHENNTNIRWKMAPD